MPTIGMPFLMDALISLPSSDIPITPAAEAQPRPSNSACRYRFKLLTRIIHEASAAAADPGMSTTLRSVGLLDVLSITPAGPSETNILTLGAKRQAPCPSAPPRYEPS
jgi:hypothetical protein